MTDKKKPLFPKPYSGPVIHEPLTTWGEIKSYNRESRVVFSVHAGWWGRADDCLTYVLPYVGGRAGLPCDPIGSPLQETDLGDWLDQCLARDPAEYGRRGHEALLACYHGNLQTVWGEPTAVRTDGEGGPEYWDRIADVIEAREAFNLTHAGRILAGESVRDVYRDETPAEGHISGDPVDDPGDDHYPCWEYVKWLEERVDELARKVPKQ